MYLLDKCLLSSYLCLKHTQETELGDENSLSQLCFLSVIACVHVCESVHMCAHADEGWKTDWGVIPHILRPCLSSGLRILVWLGWVVSPGILLLSLSPRLWCGIILMLQIELRSSWTLHLMLFQPSSTNVFFVCSFVCFFLRQGYSV